MTAKNSKKLADIADIIEHMQAYNNVDQRPTPSVITEWVTKLEKIWDEETTLPQNTNLKWQELT